MMWALLKFIFGVRHEEPESPEFKKRRLVREARLVDGRIRRVYVISYRPRLKKFRFNLENAWYDLRAGIYNEYPLCCVLHFVYDTLHKSATDPSGRLPSALARGGIHDGRNKQWAACGWHSGRHPGYERRNDEYYRYLGRHRKKTRREAKTRRPCASHHHG